MKVKAIASLLLLVVSGFLGVIMHPTVLWGVHLPDMGFLAWFYLVPLFVSLQLSNKFVFSKALFTSLITFLGSLYWLSYAMTTFGGLDTGVSILVCILAALIQAVFFALSTKLSFNLFRKSQLPLFLLLALFLGLQDYFRTYFPVNGFPWSMPLYSQGHYIWLFQWVQFTGIHGLNILIYLVNALIADLVLSFIRKNRDISLSRSISLVIIGSLLFSVQYLMLPFFDNAALQPAGTVSLIQGNINQDEKWDRGHLKRNIQKHIDLSVQADIEGSDLIVWPETAYPFAVQNNEIPLPNNKITSPLLIGAVTDDPSGVYNSAYLIDSDDKVIGSYSKRHLVPFGEYIPFKKWLSFARQLTVSVGEFTPGNKAIPLTLGAFKLGLLICYEDIFHDLARESVLNGANILVNLTNDAWYGQTSAQWQHLVFSQFRALENRRYLLRATNTGLTAVINDRGEVLSQLDDFTAEFLSSPVKINDELSFYTRHGDIVIYVAFILVSLVFINSFFKRR